MPSGPNIAPRGYSVVTNPERFSNFPQKVHKPDGEIELLIFDNQSNATGVTVYSEPIFIAPAEGFSVHVDPETSGNVIIEGMIGFDAAFWNPVTTISNGGYYSSDEKIPIIRIGLANGVSAATVWLYRKYSTY